MTPSESRQWLQARGGTKLEMIVTIREAVKTSSSYRARAASCNPCQCAASMTLRAELGTQRFHHSMTCCSGVRIPQHWSRTGDRTARHALAAGVVAVETIPGSDTIDIVLINLPWIGVHSMLQAMPSVVQDVSRGSWRLQGIILCSDSLGRFKQAVAMHALLPHQRQS